MLSDHEGVAAVRLARQALDQALVHGGSHPPAKGGMEVLPPVFDELRGVFVTLKRHPSGALRGCIGYPLPILPLRTALERAAVSAAVEDYRFRPVHGADLPHISIEVSVLTPPVPIRFSRPDEAVRAVQVGRDGLIVEGFGSSGLLLPQVAPEEGWSAEDLLEGTCEKAGLTPNAWKDPRVTVKRFEAEIFREVAPGGDVVRVDAAELTTGGSSAPKN